MATITVEELSERLKKTSRGAFLAALHSLALDYAAEAQTRAYGRATTLLTRRSGRLSGSIVGRVQKRPGYIAVRLSAGGGGEDVKYAAIHEHGGTITPKKGKYLRFPVSDDAFTQNNDPKGAGVSRGAGGSVWASVRSVTIPARPYLKPSIDEIEARMIPEVRRVLRGVL
jgi:phage gpG-like protein